ncbi:hypothetical protein PV10_00521 [Exophiala mesophila]|uniref:Uncharacterized protein n=1 Tax=Exophiala mesophila TaxID=212818 RepID=A0A0D2ACK5_EXOME|nr:uncharacterized protein PV10_00521 [Exophiala mesophila]KIV96688.1 hypothetical protein PV10_00521 [Exophiala mesophila]
MADTRCANPELQFDVDMMMLEYALYHATKAHLDALSDDCMDPDQAGEASRLLSIFDTLMRLFNLNHAGYVKSGELCLGLKLLEFLVLLSSIAREDDNQLLLQQQHTFSAAHQQALRSDGFQALRSRRAWLAARNAEPMSSQGSLSLYVEKQIYNAWTVKVRPTNNKPSSSSPVFKPGLFQLIPRFMDISGDIMAAIRQDPNETWTEIAGEFMLQASLDSLRMQIPVSKDTASPAGPRPPRLEECFAWGYVQNPPGDNAWLINDLFREHPDIDDDDDDVTTRSDTTTKTKTKTPAATISSPVVETPLWTETRARFLSEFHIADAASTSSQTCRLERLEAKYPPAQFVQTLVGFMRQIWATVCDDQMLGTPLLVQIEEGHLKSLGVQGAAFDDFLVRVGLKPDYGGLLKLKL